MTFAKYLAVSTLGIAVVVALMVLQSYLREIEEASQPLTCHAQRCT
ncbi:hypothetical protein [Paraburkholderia unamae]|nr:hypothetical protein [Paraburkholderia unamae]